MGAQHWRPEARHSPHREQGPGHHREEGHSHHREQGHSHHREQGTGPHGEQGPPAAEPDVSGASASASESGENGTWFPGEGA